MISFIPSMQYFLFREPTDMRKGYYGLSGIVRDHLKRDPIDGSVYIFMNRNKNKIKLLVWDRSGFVVYYKSLESGTFELPTIPKNQIKWDELVMILEGVKLSSIKRKKRFSYPQKKASKCV